MSETKVQGWKTKWGAIVVALGGALLAAAQAVPPQYLEISGWINFAGVLLSAAGASLLGVGLGHKADKMKEEIKNGAKIVLACLLPLLLIACASLVRPSQNIDPEKGPVCLRIEYQDSIICSQLVANGIANAEDIRDSILDANDVALILKIYTPQEFLSFLDAWDELLEKADVSYALYFAGVLDDLSKAKRLVSILERRFAFLRDFNATIHGSDLRLLKAMNSELRKRL